MIEWDGDNFLEAFDSGYHFSEADLEELVFESSCEEIMGEEGRWYRNVTSILKFDGRVFCINWQEGLTEMQPNDFWEQPKEVFVKTELVTVEKTSYISKKEKELVASVLKDGDQKYY